MAVAIVDGGLPANHGLDQWVTLHDAPGVGRPIAAGQAHGLAVTSAFLFGPLVQGEPTRRPHANVDHWRVYGDGDNDDFEVFALFGEHKTNGNAACGEQSGPYVVSLAR